MGGLRDRAFGALSIALLTAVASSSAIAGPAWERYSAVCEPVLAAPAASAPAALADCLARWFQTSSASESSEEERAKLATAARHLFDVGNREQKYVARSVLSELGMAPPARAAATPTTSPSAEPARAPYTPREASAADRAKARSLRKAGYRAYKKRRYRAAVGKFEAALARDPGYVQALYDLACTHALMGDGGESVEYLRKLHDIGSHEALGQVRHARVDEDFAKLRDDKAFRDATGYVRVKIVNGLGRYGEAEVARIRKELEAQRFHVAAVGPDKADRSQPIIWFRPERREARVAAYLVDQVLGHPRTKLNPIDWDSDFDIIISWGDVVRTGERGEPIIASYGPKSPEDAERKADALLHEQDKALTEKEEYARKVDRVLDSPDRMRRRVETGTRRVEKTIRKVEDTGERVIDLFD